MENKGSVNASAQYTVCHYYVIIAEYVLCTVHYVLMDRIYFSLKTEIGKRKLHDIS